MRVSGAVAHNPAPTPQPGVCYLLLALGWGPVNSTEAGRPPSVLAPVTSVLAIELAREPGHLKARATTGAPHANPRASQSRGAF